MLEFPFYSFGMFTLLFAFIGILLFFTGIYEFIKSGNPESENTFKNILAIFVGIIFFLLGTTFSIGNLWSTYEFRNINVSQVKALKVIKSEDENKEDSSKFVLYENSESIQNAFLTLKNCRSISRNHESFQDGYKFQILFFDETLNQDFYISLYRKSSNGTEKSVVMPHYYENRSINLGEFDCPEFQDWARENIDPLFQNQ